MRGIRSILLACAGAACLHAALNPQTDFLIYWPRADARALERVKAAGMQAVIVPLAADPAFAAACGRLGIVPLAYVGTAESVTEMNQRAARARAAGFRGIALDAAGALATQAALGGYLTAQKDLERIVFLGAEQLEWEIGSAHAAVRYGQWPGVRNLNQEISSASRDPWIDSNAWLVGYLRGTFPRRPPLLGYRPDEAAGVSKSTMLAYDSLGLALVEACAAGGNAVLWMPDRHADALDAGNVRMVQAWDSLSRAIAFLRKHRARFQQPPAARVALVSGTLEQSGELLNMMFRLNVAPVVVRGEAIPEFRPAAMRVLVTANVPQPADTVRKRVAAFAAAGGQVFAAPAASGDPAWWLDGAARELRKEDGREFWASGKGQVVSYPDPVMDTAEFALDVIDAMGNRTRDLRIWGAHAVIGLASTRPGGGLTLTLINYGAPQFDVLVRLEGVFRTALCETPEDSSAVVLRPVRRGSGTEIRVAKLERLALVELEAEQ